MQLGFCSFLYLTKAGRWSFTTALCLTDTAFQSLPLYKCTGKGVLSDSPISFLHQFLFMALITL